MTNGERTLASIRSEASARQNADLAEILSSPAGRRVYAMLVEASGLYGTPPAEEPARSEWLGRRAFGNEIRAVFTEAAAELAFRAEEEQRRDRAEAAERLRRAQEEDAKDAAGKRLETTTNPGE